MKSLSTPAVLIVDDDPVVRETACEMFSQFGWQCFDAYNGQDALRILSDHPEIDLLFADVRMPGMNGVDLAREAQRMRPHLKVILTSGWLDGAPVEGTPFVRKPYRVHEIATILEPSNHLH